MVGLVTNLASWERGYENCNSTYLVKASTLSGMRLQLQKQLFEVGYPKLEPSPSLLLGSRVELHPLAHAQFASWNSAQRLSPKRVRQIKIRIPADPILPQLTPTALMQLSTPQGTCMSMQRVHPVSPAQHLNEPPQH